MALFASSDTVAVDATCLVTFVGDVDRAVYWSLTNSAGTITPIHIRTDSQGRAAAVFTPDVTDLGNAVTIHAKYGQ